MTWVLEPEDSSAQSVYEILKRHRLLPESTMMAASICNTLATGERFVLKNEEDDEVIGNLFVTPVVDTGVVQLDFVPVVKHFRTGFDEPLREALVPLLTSLFEAGVRRVESSIPESRSRTKRALCTLGFKPEGRARDGIVLHGKAPEDVRMLGLLQPYLEGVTNG